LYSLSPSWPSLLPHTTEFPQTTELPQTTEFPHTTELPQTTEFPQTTELPQHTELPQTTELSQTVEGSLTRVTVFVPGLYRAVGDFAEPTVTGARSVLARAAVASTAPAPTAKMSSSMSYATPVLRSVAETYGGKPFHAVFISRAFTWSGV